MKVLNLELQKFQIDFENILNDQGTEKLILLISDTNIKNDSGRCIGKIIALINPKKKNLLLGQVVEFYDNNIKWSCSRYVNNDGLHIISDHWVKPFVEDPIVNVPITVLDHNTQKDITVMIELTYKQFQERRLLEFYGDYKHRLIAAYKNFTDLFKNNQYWYAINSTVKHYRVDQKHLIGFLSKVDNEKKKIKTEWVRYMQYHIQENQTELKIQNLLNKYNSSETRNVLTMKK